jgi:hypothetical protein
MNRGREADAGIREPHQRIGALEAETGRVDLNEVRLHLGEIHRNPCFMKTLRESLRASVILREPLDVVIERVEAGCGDDPGLPHRTAEHMLLPPRTDHQLA